MTKDVKIALGVGFLIGIISALVAINLPRLVQQLSQPTEKEIATISPVETTPQITQPKIMLIIDEPVDESIALKDTVPLRGKTVPGNIVVVDNNIESFAQETSADGSFEFSFNIQEGINDIIVSSYNPEGQSETKTVTIFRTKEQL